MTVISIEKDFDSLSLILVADFHAPIGLSEHDGGTRMELRFVFYSSEHMRQFERWGTFEVLPQSLGQMDALLASNMQTGSTREANLR